MSDTSKLGKVSVFITRKTEKAVELAYGPEGGVLELQWVPRSLLSTHSDRQVESWNGRNMDHRKHRWVLRIEQFKLDELGWEYE